ncbi:hypothetical protein B0A50_04126 [Salinomyces thailandicus]|uniref:PhoD-like phosphatase domain-containing protein n=1 Tax=Salinomyces thailandicus TaxID=706561 RepID=A0A4U0U211_9PEZI|nr:hypothetical protein B0A50_04126 [Salinomyces thailandica]
MEDRRQSGLWTSNPNTGYYEQVEPQTSTRAAQSGPYSYYQPPSKSSKEQRRSFSDRTNQPATHQPSQNGGHTSQTQSQSQSQGGQDFSPGATQKAQRRGSGAAEEPSRTGQTSNTRPRAASKAQPPLRVDPNAVPSNVRSKPWSAEPDVISPNIQRARQASNATELLRRGSVPDRSPLQKLDMELAAKEAKRARVEESEYRAQQRRAARAGMSAEKDMPRRDSTRDKGKVAREESQKAGRVGYDDGTSAREADGAPVEKFRRASDAMRQPSAERESERHPRATSGAVTYTDSRHERPIETAVNTEMGRTEGGKYRHRARDAGFAGAEAAYAGAPIARQNSAAERGKAAYERRKAQSAQPPQASPISPSGHDAGAERSGSKKLQKRAQSGSEWHGRQKDQGPRRYQDQDRRGGNLPPEQQQQQQQSSYAPHETRQQLQTDRVGAGSKKDRAAAMAFQDPDPMPPAQVASDPNNPINYKIPPQTAGGQEAKAQVGFAEVPHSSQEGDDKRHRFGGGLWHRQDHRSYKPSEPALDEWRSAGLLRLKAEDLEFERPATAVSGADRNDKNGPWWEQNGKRSSSGGSRPAAAPYDGPYEEQAMSFRPALYLKCGPLLRYTGMRREAAATSRTGRQAASDGEKEIWRGSVMIVTDDQGSDLSSQPTLRLFAQPMDLHVPPPQHLLDSGHELPPEYEDPVAGQVKLSRTGRPLFVRPVHDIEGGIDLSKEENNWGLYAATRTPMLGPQSSMGADGRESRHITFQDKSRIKKHSGETAKRYREIRAIRLHTERGATFWRFNLEIELGSRQHRVAYRINHGPAVGFWVPARGETMNTLFHSCNGFSLSVNPDDFSGPDPLWRDVLNRHQSRPFHVMLGGGDQIYNDAAMRDTTLFKEWLAIKNPEAKHRADFTPEMQEELESFYLERYSMWFSQGLFAMAGAQIPMVNVWDDHDIIDGFGSYPHHFMSSRVFTGLGAVAFKYYMLFQHQSLVAETTKEEPSWLLGASPGPYINELSRSIFMHLGRHVAFVGLDCRTERMRDEVLSQDTYDLIFDRLRREVIENETKHLIVLLGVPIAYPRLNFLENLLTSKMMDPVKALGRTGMLGGFVNKFDGGVEILDDLDDHWTAKHHKAERNWFIQELQDFAAEKSVRVTILGGDVHLGAIGQFYTPKKYQVPKDKDHRYMPNVVSSAIVNTPPPNAMADILNKRNKVHHLDDETDEDMIPLFEADVGGAKRNNRHLLPRRNYCVIREYVPGSTPPASPRREGGRPPGTMDGAFEAEEEGGRGRKFPPGSMKRSMSLTRPGALFRRLSGSGGRSRNPPVSLGNDARRPESAQSYGSSGPPPPPQGMPQSNSMGGPHPNSGSYFPPTQDGAADARPSFRRRPTDLSVREARQAAARGGAGLEDGEDGHADPAAIDLEGGLDITLNMEVDQRDPGGATVPYRLLVPALWYDGEADENVAEFKGRKGGLLGRLRGSRRGKKDEEESEEDEEEHGGGRDGNQDARDAHNDRDDRSLTPRPPPPPPTRQKSAPQHIRGVDEAAVAPWKAGSAGPPSRQRPRASSDAAAHGNDYEAPSEPRSSAYTKGYNMAAPPIGAGYHPSSHAAGSRGQPSVPHSGHQKLPAQASYRREAAVSEDSLTPSEASEAAAAAAERDGPVKRARRPSKAERFFGLGDERGGEGGGGGGRSGSMAYQQDEGGGEERDKEKKKPGWKLWKS